MAFTERFVATFKKQQQKTLQLNVWIKSEQKQYKNMSLVPYSI